MARKAENMTTRADWGGSTGRRSRFVPDIALAMAAWPLLWVADRFLDRIESGDTADRCHG